MPHYMFAVPSSSFALAFIPTGARKRTTTRRPVRVYPSVPEWNPPEEDDATLITTWEAPPTRQPLEFTVHRDAQRFEAPVEVPAPPQVEGDALRPYEPPEREQPPPAVSDPERKDMEPAQAPEFPSEPGPRIMPPPSTPKPKLTPPEQPGWLPPESDEKETDERAVAETVVEAETETEWHPRGFPGVET